MKRKELVDYLDHMLRIPEISDYGPQGLQIEGRDEVEKLAVGVDAAHATIDGALDAGADLLLVHHGIFWGPARTIAGAFGRKVRKLILSDLNLYAAHLALDAHPTVGNNAELCRLLDLEPVDTYFTYQGLDCGLIAVSSQGRTLADIVQDFTRRLRSPLHVAPYGPEKVGRVAVSSGDSVRSLEEAFACGCDTLITGETDYTMVHMPEELGMNVIYGGHYLTETLGIQALARHLCQQFPLSWAFIDVPVHL